jgi:threonine/homoserine/homoserine lactone efflux protein
MSVDMAGFLIFAIAMVGSPGPANMVLMTSGARFGLRRSLPFVAGVALSKQIVIWPVGFGLLTLAAAAPGLFIALKWASAAYVLWLAWKIAGARIVPGAAAAEPPGFANGLVVHPLNPKAWAMVAAGFAQFTNPDAPILANAAAIAFGFALVQSVLHPTWCLAGEGVAKLAAGGRGERILMISLAILTIASVGWALLNGAPS